jgi:hypothetical protein
MFFRAGLRALLFLTISIIGAILLSGTILSHFNIFPVIPLNPMSSSVTLDENQHTIFFELLAGGPLALLFALIMHLRHGTSIRMWLLVGIVGAMMLSVVYEYLYQKMVEATPNVMTIAQHLPRAGVYIFSFFIPCMLFYGLLHRSNFLLPKTKESI